MLREHKPPPIRWIRISDFGLPDPKRDPDRQQNCITWSLSHALVALRTDRQTDRQTSRQIDNRPNKNITSFFSGNNKREYAQTEQTSAEHGMTQLVSNTEDPDFGLWTPGFEAWSGLPPKLYHSVLEPCPSYPTPTKNFVKIRLQVCE